jgi:hypothetical protein
MINFIYFFYELRLIVMKSAFKKISKKNNNNITQTKKRSKTKRTMSKTRLSQKGYYDKPFLKYSRLPILDRKYCSCIMAVRHKKYKSNNEDMNPYAICTNNVYLRRNKKKNRSLNCSINYDFDNYHMDYLKAYAKEKGVSVTYVNSEGKRVSYAKSTLISKLRKLIIDKKKSK